MHISKFCFIATEAEKIAWELANTSRRKETLRGENSPLAVSSRLYKGEYAGRRATLSKFLSEIEEKGIPTDVLYGPFGRRCVAIGKSSIFLFERDLKSYKSYDTFDPTYKYLIGRILLKEGGYEVRPAPKLDKVSDCVCNSLEEAINACKVLEKLSNTWRNK